MNPWIAFIAAGIGYVCGTVSFTRIVGRYIAPGDDMGDAEIPLNGSEQTFHLRSYGATSIRAKAGAKYGCLTSLLDMLKLTMPTLLFRHLYPESFYFLIVAACGIAGHNFPVFYGFKGGRGFSPLYGGLLVIDWLAIPASTLVGLVVGFWMFRHPFFAYFGVMLMLLPWFWFRFEAIAYFLYALSVNLFFWAASIPDLKQYAIYKRQGVFDKTGRFAGLNNPFTLGPLMKIVRRLGRIRNQEEKPKSAQGKGT